jgi:hypothetical protein
VRWADTHVQTINGKGGVADSSLREAKRERDEILRALASFPDELERVALRGKDVETLRRPASDGGWGVVEILPHLRDWEEIYLERVRRIATEEHPHLPGYDDTLWSIERDYRGQNPHEVFAAFRALRAELVQFLSSLPPEAWTRTGEHGYYGDITLGWLCEHIREHDQEHLEQARDALAG